MSIHIRNAFDMFWNIMNDYNPSDIEGVLHCFSGDEDDARRAVEHYPNLMFGVNGTITYKNSKLPEMFRKLIPLSRVLLETDAPYLSPIPNRGKRNEPSNLLYVCDFLGLIYEKKAEEISRETDKNACQMFKI